MADGGTRLKVVTLGHLGGRLAEGESGLGKAYDLTKFARVHPGGAKLIYDAAGDSQIPSLVPRQQSIPWMPTTPDC